MCIKQVLQPWSQAATLGQPCHDDCLQAAPQLVSAKHATDPYPWRQVKQSLIARRVRCVRIRKRVTNPQRSFKVGDDPVVYAGLMNTIEAIVLNEAV